MTLVANVLQSSQWATVHGDTEAQWPSFWEQASFPNRIIFIAMKHLYPQGCGGQSFHLCLLPNLLSCCDYRRFQNLPPHYPSVFRASSCVAVSAHPALDLPHPPSLRTPPHAPPSGPPPPPPMWGRLKSGSLWLKTRPCHLRSSMSGLTLKKKLKKLYLETKLLHNSQGGRHPVSSALWGGHFGPWQEAGYKNLRKFYVPNTQVNHGPLGQLDSFHF